MMENTQDKRRSPAHNSTYKKLAVQCSADTFVVNQTLVLRIKFCGENRQLLVAATRWQQLHGQMRLQLTILTSFLVCSCGTKESDFDLLIKNLKKLDVGYTYDQIKQDAENCYTPDKNGDSLFYTPTVPILGLLPDNGEIFSIIHFEPGDDFYPILRTFDKEGKMIDQDNVAYGYCAGWDCDFDECEEGFKIIDKTTILDILTLVTTLCDSLGNKNSSLTKKETRHRTITMDNNGKISVSEKVE